jgi:NADH-quinone oxidoreductase subunit E
MPKFSDHLLSQIQEMVTHYPQGKQKSALLPVLHLVQDHYQGWLSSELMDEVATLLSLKPIEVYEVASFYSMYNLKPVGKYVLQVCQTGPCCLVGSEKILNYLQQQLGIKVGETTTDGLFSLKVVECLAACGQGPVLQIGDRYYEHLTEEKIDHLLTELRTVS